MDEATGRVTLRASGFLLVYHILGEILVNSKDITNFNFSRCGLFFFSTVFVEIHPKLLVSPKPNGQLLLKPLRVDIFYTLRQYVEHFCTSIEWFLLNGDVKIFSL